MSGGFSVFEAPEPLGPWRTVYYSEEWDVGWRNLSLSDKVRMSEDGKTVNMVFSGDDSFSVRQAVFETSH
ncbi:MAG: hypothetical protein R2748_16190 [Bryobacterales bacterium]